MECLRDDFNGGVVLGGRYETISPLNHGSFGMVFKAYDQLTGDTVAIKCLTKKSAADEIGYEFAVDDKSEELILHRRLGRHPNIVSLVDSFETEAHIYLVLEYCQQGDLYEAIRVDQGPLETEHVRRFMLELVDAVAYIHAKGIYHRDIKPENIFLGKDGSVKLGDFGLATTDKWTFETAVGSDRYMSPEQYDSAGAGYSPAQADIWAVGICLLNILFSRNPFTTPTESDPLFLDFSRDKQSLFDVFPSMSQDTYEVIVECMNLDPSKRSLVGARRALNRVVSFTTLDEGDDEFCAAEREDTIATANREPLRTPSIQSPQVDTGAFPWTRALHGTSAVQPMRQLSMIPDNESYTEDLFSKSAATTDWTSAQTPSVLSVMNSGLPASMQLLSINPPKSLKPAARISPMAGSLPISMSKPRNIPSMASVFGGKETVSKSWSDLWEEEEEENQLEEQARQLQALKKMNSRTWSQDSKVEDDNTPRQGLSPAVRSSVLNAKPQVPCVEDAIDMDGDLPDDFFFQDTIAVKHHDLHPPKHAPSKKDSLDKWAQLGERRRAYTGHQESMPKPDFMLKSGRAAGNFFGYGVGDSYGSMHFNNFSLANHHNHMMNNKHQTRGERVKECPWGKSKGRDFNWNWRREKRLGDVEWVGASWQEAHS